MSRRKPTDEILGLADVNKSVIYPHVFENADREVGGVLVGRQPADGGLPLVTGAIQALSADEQRATLTFTQDTWEHVHHVLDTQYGEDEQIVGWYHSHPGFGIFLSEHDLFIHRNFFSGTSQIALVVDPLAGVDGVFVWRDGQVEPLYERPTPGWRGLAPNAGVGSIPPPGADGPVATAAGTNPDRRMWMAAGGLLAFILGGVVAAAIHLGGTPDTKTVPTTVVRVHTKTVKSSSTTVTVQSSTAGGTPGRSTAGGQPATAGGAPRSRTQQSAANEK